MTDERRLLVARRSGDGQGAAEQADGSLSPLISAQPTIRGRAALGTLNRSHRSSRHSRVRRSIREVRLALVASVAWLGPFVSFHTSQASMVPSLTSPFSARSRAPGTLSSSQANFVAEK
jgi:hypothetical protein